MRVVAVRFVKGRKLPNGRVDVVGAFGVVAWIHVGLCRLERNRRELHVLRVNRLTTDDYDLGVIRDLARRADDRFELNTIHKWCRARLPSKSRRTGLTGEVGSRVRSVPRGIARPD